MSDFLAAIVAFLLCVFLLGWWSPTVVVRHGSAPPDTISVTMPLKGK